MNGTFYVLLRLGLYKSVVLLGLLAQPVTAQVGLPPIIAVQPLDTNVLNGGGASLLVVATSFTTMNYQWHKNGTPIFGATTASYTISTANATDEGGYHVEVRNSSGTTISRTARVTVLLANDIPSVAPDSYSTAEDVRLNVSASGVLTNDSDQFGEPLMAWLVAQPTNGTVTFNPDGSFHYQPATNFWGSDRFSYVASDGQTTIIEQNATGSDKVEVQSDEPASQSFRHGVTGEPSYEISKVLLRISRKSSRLDPLGFSIGTGVNSGALPRSSHTIYMSGVSNISAGLSFQDYLVTYSPPAGPFSAGRTYYLNVQFPGAVGKEVYLRRASSSTYPKGTSYRDGSDENKDLIFAIHEPTVSGVATVDITVTPVDDPPSAGNDTATVAEDSWVTVNVLANDSDTEGDPLTITSVSATDGAAVISGTNIVFTPATNFFGTATVTYIVSDGALFATGSVTVVVSPVNDAPIAHNDNASTLEDVSVSIPVLLNDTDVESPGLIITNISTTNGTAVVSTSGTDIIFTPSTNYYGTVVFNYMASDGTNSSTASVTVGVTPVYDAPVAINDSTNTLEDTGVTIQVVANDYNPDRSPLTLTTVSSPNGTAVITGTNILFTPATNEFGTVVLNYTISDGTSLSTASVTVTVLAVNDLPVANDDAYTTFEDVPLTIPAPGVLDNDSDMESAFTASLVTSPAHGTVSLRADGSFTYTTSSNYFGADSFTYRASDGSALSAVKTVSLSTIVTTPLTIRCTSLDSNGATLLVIGPAPSAYTILASTNNTDWIPLWTNVALTGDVTVRDPAGGLGSMRFYRARMSAQATTVIDGNPSGGSQVDVRATKEGSQSFRKGFGGDPNFSISKIVLNLSRTATVPNADLNISIGTALNSGAIDGSGISVNPAVITDATSGPSFQAYEIIYTTPIVLRAGVTYYLNIDCEAPNGGRIYVETSTFSSAYPNGSFYRNGSDQGVDAVFQIWGQ